MCEEENVLNEESTDLFEHHKIIVDKGQSLLRIDKFLCLRLDNISRNRIQNAANANCILVNNLSVKSNYLVKPNDVISIVLPYPPNEKEILPENIPLNIAYEDDDLILINKPAGMVVHPAKGNYTGTLVNALLWYFKDLPLFNKKTVRPGLVHRIDKDTSGLLVIAKTEIAHSILAKQFFDKTTERSYIALVWGIFKEKTGTIIGNIGRSPRDRKKMAIFPDNDFGKHAVTHYKVLEEFRYTSLVECKLETGRTHQIRAHFEHIKHPLFNDSVYGGNKIIKGNNFSKYSQFVENCFQICPRQALHAKSLGFFHPSTKKWVFFDSNLPDDMKILVDKWKNYNIYD
ncbi:MAG: RNA pseudouridine synthase [Bacteroidetes bacterium CG02_land_8_20_14_3_00_31_25]|nr:MAG: RNA pseudouridine synthase [Bacteroidetes bacterium CG02_land_8_20_14_3_00_31_25]PIX32850.1 MAG: RNA pseudouridine synthase [Bacteroidetes bacterium CG_4_8_14_3_um_filter_31_14]PIY02140.1 MAG: RNA pseudouridine synthase [Bacteroidetes bacterium CG_4_10_14_3_um_filter_31_20]